MKKSNFLNINPSNMIVLKFHMLLLYIYHQTVSKQCLLVGESRYQSYVYFQALKRHFLAKIMFFQKISELTHFNFTVWPFKWKIMIGPLIWYQICNCNHHTLEEILNFHFSVMSSYSWICPYTRNSPFNNLGNLQAGLLISSFKLSGFWYKLFNINYV